MCAKYPHYYQVQSHSGGWALGRCKWCKRIEPLRDYPKLDLHGQQILPTSADKRKFLRSLSIPVSRKRWDESEVEALIDSVQKVGINKTAKLFDIPTSTLHLWMKEHSPFPSYSKKYTKEFKMKAVSAYEKRKNFYGVAKDFGIPRATLQKWVKDGFN